MCQFYSCVVTKKETFDAYGVDSHDQIISIHNLDHLDKRENVGLVRIEMLPNNPMTLDFDSWTCKVDQDIIPDWFNAEKAKMDIIKRLRSAPSITKDTKYCHEQIMFCTAKVDVLCGYGSLRFMLDNSQVGKMLDNSRVGVLLDNSQVGEMWGNSRVGVLLDNSQVGEMWGNSQVGEMWGNSKIVIDGRDKK